MSRQLFALVTLALFTVLTAASAGAQATAQVRILSLDSATYPRITITFTAQGADGRSFVGLTQSQVQVIEAEVAIEEETFSEEAQPGVGAAISIVFDSDKQLEPHIPAGRSAVEWFLDQTGKSPDAKAEVLSLYLPIASPGQELQPLGRQRFIATTDRNVLINQLRTLAPREGETSMYQALDLAIRDTGRAAREQGGGGIVVVVSDGADLSPNAPTVSDLVTLAQNEHVRVVAFGLGQHSDSATADPRLLLSNLAVGTGGDYLQADTTDQSAVAELFAEVAPLTPASHYRLSYISRSPRDGKEYQTAIIIKQGDNALMSATQPFTTPSAAVSLRPLSIALLEYLLFALPIALLVSIGTTVIIFTARRFTSSRQEEEIRRLANAPTTPTTTRPRSRK